MTRLHVVLRLLAALGLMAAWGGAPAASEITDERLAPLTNAYMAAVRPGEQADLHRELLGTLLRRVQRSYAYEVDMPRLITVAAGAIQGLAPQSGEPAAVFKKAVDAALASLDPHSRYLDPRAQSNLRSMVSGSFGGVGLTVDAVDGLVRVVSAIPGTPAARAGLRGGDLILQLGEEPVQGMTLADAVARMRGAPGTPIDLLVRRPGAAEDFTVTLVRETIRTQPVRARMEGEVLVLRLASFTSSVSALLEHAIAEATAERSPSGIVLDMRGNPGGSFHQAVMTADAFLGAGDIVSIFHRGSGKRRIWRATPEEHFPGVPMVVLIDGRSASAAEVVAAALQDHGRATVMGQRSFGKGSVQAIIPLGEDRGALRLTIALYHTPSGRTVQRGGVGPDIELGSAATAAAGPRRREADRANALPGADEPLPPKARIAPQRCPGLQAPADPALACAVAYLQTGTLDEFVAALAP